MNKGVVEVTARLGIGDIFFVMKGNRRTTMDRD